MQEGLCHLAVVPTFREPVHKLQLRKSTRCIRDVYILEVQTVGDVVFWIDLLDFVCGQDVEA